MKAGEYMEVQYKGAYMVYTKEYSMRSMAIKKFLYILPFMVLLAGRRINFLYAFGIFVVYFPLFV